MKKMTTKKHVVSIGYNKHLPKAVADISFKKLSTGYVDLVVRRTNEYISLTFTDSEMIELRKAIQKHWGY